MGSEGVKRGHRRIVCAAIRNSHGQMVLGPRHYDRVMARSLLEGTYDWKDGEEVEQGFIDQWGNFHSRIEAWKIAEAAGQILYRCGGDTADGGTLYSENLY